MAPALNANPVLDRVRGRVADTVRNIVVGNTTPVQAVPWHPDDPGMFPMDHAVRIVHSDASMFIGGVRSLLLQSLHPKAMYGVANHSNFREDPLGRLQRTSAFLAKTTFGRGSEAAEAVEIVRRVHLRVQGTMPDGSSYSASDPHLLRWVHITEVGSFLDAFQRYGSTRITDTQADEYVSGMAAVGLALGMTDAPRTVAELKADLRRYRPELAATAESEEATLFLLAPPLPLAVKPAFGLMFGAALASLPPWARNMLQLPIPNIAFTFTVRPAALVMTRSLQWALNAAPTPAAPSTSWAAPTRTAIPRTATTRTATTRTATTRTATTRTATTRE